MSWLHVTIFIMKIFKNYILIILICTFLMILVGCPLPAQDNQDSGGTDIAGGQGGNTPSGTDGGETTNSGISIDPLPIEMLVKLGYDESQLVVGDKELLPGDERLVWNLVIEDAEGPLATAVIDEDRSLVEWLRFETPPDDSAPPVVRPGDDLPERVAGALGFADMGYKPMQEGIGEHGVNEYRRYETSGDWEICVSRVSIYVKPDEKTLVSINWLEYQIPDEISVEIDRDEAIAIVAELFADTSFTPSRMELILFQFGRSPILDIVLVWEVVTDMGTLRIRCDDGTFL